MKGEMVCIKVFCTCKYLDFCRDFGFYKGFYKRKVISPCKDNDCIWPYSHTLGYIDVFGGLFTHISEFDGYWVATDIYSGMAIQKDKSEKRLLEKIFSIGVSQRPAMIEKYHEIIRDMSEYYKFPLNNVGLLWGKYLKQEVK